MTHMEAIARRDRYLEMARNSDSTILARLYRERAAMWDRKAVEADEAATLEANQ
ncbi:hypothetical protein [Roseobacter phage RDJL6]|nr:hypothetical protein [Roseobacter phage RDJL6]